MSSLLVRFHNTRWYNGGIRGNKIFNGLDHPWTLWDTKVTSVIKYTHLQSSGTNVIEGVDCFPTGNGPIHRKKHITCMFMHCVLWQRTLVLLLLSWIYIYIYSSYTFNVFLYCLSFNKNYSLRVMDNFQEPHISKCTMVMYTENNVT